MGDAVDVRDLIAVAEAESVERWTLPEYTRHHTQNLRYDVSASGELLVSQSLQPVAVGNARFTLESAAGTELTLLDRSDSKSERWPNYGGHVDDRYIVWKSTAGGDNLGGEKWQLWSYDRATKQTHQIAQAADLPGIEVPPPVAGYTIPVVSGGTVYWAGNVWLTKEQKRRFGSPTRIAPAVFSAPLDGSQPPRRMAMPALLPVTGGPYVYWGIETWSDDKPIEIVRLDTGDGSRTVIRPDVTKGFTIRYLVATGHWLAWIETDQREDVVEYEPDRMIVQDQRDGSTHTLVAEQDMPWVWPTAGEGFFVWSVDGAQGAFAYEPDSRTLVRLAGNYFGPPDLAATGDYVQYFTPASAEEQWGGPPPKRLRITEAYDIVVLNLGKLLRDHRAVEQAAQER